MPSYRARLQIGDLLPGHRPEEVMDLAEAAVQATPVSYTHLRAHET